MTAQSLLNKLTKTYGIDEGNKVYAAMLGSGMGPFAKGAKHHADHLAFAEQNGIAPSDGKRKAPAPRGKRGPVRKHR